MLRFCLFLLVRWGSAGISIDSSWTNTEKPPPPIAPPLPRKKKTNKPCSRTLHASKKGGGVKQKHWGKGGCGVGVGVGVWDGVGVYGTNCAANAF